jgi:hypothetical protein
MKVVPVLTKESLITAYAKETDTASALVVALAWISRPVSFCRRRRWRWGVTRICTGYACKTPATAPSTDIANLARCDNSRRRHETPGKKPRPLKTDATTELIRCGLVTLFAAVETPVHGVAGDPRVIKNPRFRKNRRSRQQRKNEYKKTFHTCPLGLLFLV